MKMHTTNDQTNTTNQSVCRNDHSNQHHQPYFLQLPSYTTSNQYIRSYHTDPIHSTPQTTTPIDSHHKMSLTNLLATSEANSFINPNQFDPSSTLHSAEPLFNPVTSSSQSPNRSITQYPSRVNQVSSAESSSSNLPPTNSLIDLLNEGIKPQLNLHSVNRASSDYLDRHPIYRVGRQSTNGIVSQQNILSPMTNIDSYNMKQDILIPDEILPSTSTANTTKNLFQSTISITEPKTKRPWTKQEDALLRALVEQLGQGLWAAIAAQIPGRTGKQVRERWLNHLSPNVTKRPWSVEEDEIIIESHRSFGNSWSRIAKLLEGRSDNSVKNRFYTTLRRKIAPQRTGVKRESPISDHGQTQRKRFRSNVQPPSEQVELFDRRYSQPKSWK